MSTPTGIRPKSLDVATGQRAQFTALTRDASRLEVEDAFFNTGSAVFLPDVPGSAVLGTAQPRDFSNHELFAALHLSHNEFAVRLRATPFTPDMSGGGGSSRETGLHVILAALRFLERNHSHALVVAGHTDRSGDDALNVRLSSARARSTLALLEGKRRDFVSACAEFSAPEDDPVILGFAARTRGWPCAPSDSSRASPDEIRAFQRRFNEDFKASIAVDGRVGNETRGAYFDLYEADLAASAGGRPALEGLRGQLRFVNSSKKFLALGERFPIENAAQDGFRSQRNRRVELLFFAPPRVPDVTAADAGEQLFRRKLFAFSMLDRDVLAKSMVGAGENEPPSAITITVLDETPAVIDERLTTSMPNVGRPDPSDPWSFLGPFHDLHPFEGPVDRSEPFPVPVAGVSPRG